MLQNHSVHLFSKEIRIYVTPVKFFTIKFRGIFQSTMFTHTTSRESKKWLSGPDMRYWPRQLNFAFWFATTGWGISTETLNIGAEQMKIILSHILRILCLMGGIQSFSALTEDPSLNQINNEYDVNSHNRLCKNLDVYI